jgi:hypothetical protein
MMKKKKNLTRRKRKRKTLNHSMTTRKEGERKRRGVNKIDENRRTS